MKRLLLLVLIIAMLLFSACGDGIVNNPIEVADNVKVGMTHAQVVEVVDLKYFQDNRSYWTCMVDGVKVDGEDFTFRYSQEENAPWYGMLFFSVESKTLNPALVILRWPDEGPAITNARVVAVCDRDAGRRGGDWSDSVGNIGDRRGQQPLKLAV